ncbi:MAG: VTT domain-containing protein [Candidatus Omnitrophica bacterium]|nr:VTT domain-containing protein [Candidatus Omnitrophota bacterium]
MGPIKEIADLFIHIDHHLGDMINVLGPAAYLMLFAIIFAETGLVVTPFLPGDSLLFMTGAIAALGSLNIFALFALLGMAAVIGDSVNYAVGKYLGLKMFKKESRFLKAEYIERTHRFYEKYGAKTIVLARFVPIVRTFAPFVAGMGSMNYAKFLTYNVAGGVLWVGLFLFGGFLFGNIPVIKNNFGVNITHDNRVHKG